MTACDWGDRICSEPATALVTWHGAEGWVLERRHLCGDHARFARAVYPLGIGPSEAA